ncbi:MAG: hypothetical protein AB1896_11585 [Thermodesulfobacteriota bacterium]
MTFLVPILLDTTRSEALDLSAGLAGTFEELPPTTCARKTECCALLPRMSLAEACLVWEKLEALPGEALLRVSLRLVQYYYLNAVRIMGCPFMEEKDCLVYTGRPFVCRAYGLWSPAEYRRQSRTAREDGKRMEKAWADLGIRLPRDVTGPGPPYCREVRLASGASVSDLNLHQLSGRIQDLDRRLPFASEFARKYGNDLSFLAAATSAGFEAALRNKVSVVREHLAGGRSASLEYLLAKLKNG